MYATKILHYVYAFCVSTRVTVFGILDFCLRRSNAFVTFFNMGAMECCLGGADSEVETPDPDVRRQQMLAAAERRKKLEDSRGLKNPERYHEQQRVSSELGCLVMHCPNTSR